jgi:predicted XRE-type DNA-binding protein
MPEPAAAGSTVESAARSEPGAHPAPEPGAHPEPGNEPGASLPVMPGFREIALRRSADAQAAQAARMAGERGRLVRELAEQRQAAGLSQTEVAARMGTSQSAVARLESGTADVRASTLERYAAAVGSEITWKLNRPGDPG